MELIACPLLAHKEGFLMYIAEVVDSKKWVLIDNGGRRLGKERRIYSYNNYIPERRSGGEDRRRGRDRRIHPRFP